MVNETVEKHFLEQALYELRMASDHLKRANGADLLNTGLVCDCLNYKKMIELLVVGVTEMLDGRFEAEEEQISRYTIKPKNARLVCEMKEKGATLKEIREMFGKDIVTVNPEYLLAKIEGLEKRLTALEWSVAEG